MSRPVLDLVVGKRYDDVDGHFFFSLFSYLFFIMV